MIVAGRSNGTVAGLTGGSAQEAGEDCTVCCGTACANTTGCEGEYVLTACNGFQFVLPIVTSSSGTYSKTISYADTWQHVAFDTSTVHGSHNHLDIWVASNSFAPHDILALDLDIEVTLSTPSRKLYWSSVHELKGYYLRHVINGSSYVFDATPETGVTITTAETDRPIEFGSPGAFRVGLPDSGGAANDSTITGTYDVDNVDELWVKEEWFVKSSAGNVFGLEHKSFITGSYWRSVVTNQELHYTITTSAVPTTTDRYFVQLHEHGYELLTTTPLRQIFVGGGDTVSACDGVEQSWTNQGYVFRPLYVVQNSSTSGGEIDVSPPLSPVFDAMSGGGTAALDNDFDESDIGCWDCPKILDMELVLTDVPVLSSTKKIIWDETDWDGDYPTLASGLELATVTVAARMQRFTRAECASPYNCLWTAGTTENTPATIQAPGGDPQDVTVSLERLGPNLWALTIPEIADFMPPGVWYVKFAGDCPTTEATICQAPNPHMVAVNGNTAPSSYHGEVADGSSYSDHTITYELQSPYSTTYTAHTIEFTEGEDLPGDPRDACEPFIPSTGEFTTSGVDDYWEVEDGNESGTFMPAVVFDGLDGLDYTPSTPTSAYLGIDASGTAWNGKRLYRLRFTLDELPSGDITGWLSSDNVAEALIVNGTTTATMINATLNSFTIRHDIELPVANLIVGENTVMILVDETGGFGALHVKWRQVPA